MPVRVGPRQELALGCAKSRDDAVPIAHVRSRDGDHAHEVATGFCKLPGEDFGAVVRAPVVDQHELPIELLAVFGDERFETGDEVRQIPGFVVTGNDDRLSHGHHELSLTRADFFLASANTMNFIPKKFATVEEPVAKSQETALGTASARNPAFTPMLSKSEVA